MKLLSAKEVCNITKENIRNNALDQVMIQIIKAAKNGQYGLIIRKNYSKEESDIILKSLLDLGYNVQIKTCNYTGTLKTYIEITINWYD